MSVSFHAFRNIGFSFTQAEATCAGWRKKFTGFDVEHAATKLGLKIEEERILVPYFGNLYRLNSADGVVEKLVDEKTNAWTEHLNMNEALVIYHYLGDTAEHPRHAGIWVPESTLDPVTYRTADRTAPMLKGFSADYGDRPHELIEKCMNAGGTPIDVKKEKINADYGWDFSPFAQVTIRLLFWEADEDFPANTAIQVDQYVTDYLDYEAVGFVMADLFVKIDQGVL